MTFLVVLGSVAGVVARRLYQKIQGNNPQNM